MHIFSKKKIIFRNKIQNIINFYYFIVLPIFNVEDRKIYGSF